MECHVAVEELVDLVLQPGLFVAGGGRGGADALDELQRRRAVVKQRLREALAARVRVHVNGIVALVADHGLLVKGHDVVDLVHKGHQVRNQRQVRAVARRLCPAQREDEVGKRLGDAALEPKVAGKGRRRPGRLEPCATLQLDEVGAEELEHGLDNHVAVPRVVVLLANGVRLRHERAHDFGVHGLAGDESRAVAAQRLGEQVAQVVDGEGKGGELAQGDLQLARVLGVEPPGGSSAELRNDLHPLRGQLLVQTHIDDLLVEGGIRVVGRQLEAGLGEKVFHNLLVCGQGYRLHILTLWVGCWGERRTRALGFQRGQFFGGHGDVGGDRGLVPVRAGTSGGGGGGGQGGGGSGSGGGGGRHGEYRRLKRIEFDRRAIWEV